MSVHKTRFYKKASKKRLTTFRNGKANSVPGFKPSSLRQIVIVLPFAPPTPL